MVWLMYHDHGWRRADFRVWKCLQVSLQMSSGVTGPAVCCLLAVLTDGDAGGDLWTDGVWLTSDRLELPGSLYGSFCVSAPSFCLKLSFICKHETTQRRVRQRSRRLFGMLMHQVKYVADYCFDFWNKKGSAGWRLNAFGCLTSHISLHSAACWLCELHFPPW